VPTCHAADRLAGLQGLFDKADLLVVTPSPPTLGAQHIDLHSRRDLKARLKVKSSGRLANYTRRPPPEEYAGKRDCGHHCHRAVSLSSSGNEMVAAAADRALRFQRKCEGNAYLARIKAILSGPDPS
jgi:hypothetical protein